MKPAETPAIPDGAGGRTAGLAERVAPARAPEKRSDEAQRPVPEAAQAAGEQRADRGDPDVRRQGIKLAAAATVASFLGALYLEHGDGLLLAGASTALALIAYWLAEHELGPGRGR